MGIYIITVSILFCLAFLDVFANFRTVYTCLYQTFWSICVSGLVLIAGFRACGVDFNEYITIHYYIQQGDFFTEPAHVLLNRLFVNFGWVVLIMACLSLLPKAYIFRKISPYPFLSLFLLLSPWFFTQDMGQYRQAVSTGFCLLSTLFMYKEKRWKALWLVVVAMMFHYSAVFFLPALLIPTTAFSIRWSCGVFIVSLLLGALCLKLLPFMADYLFPYLSDKIRLYTEENTTGNLINVSMLVKIALWMLAYSQKDIIVQYPNGGYFLNLYFIHFCLLFAFFPFPAIAGRAGLSYKIVELVLIPYLIRSYRLTTNKIWMTIFVLLVFLYGTYNFLSSMQEAYIPYKNWLYGG